MSLDPPPYLGSLQNNIRQRPIPWDGAARAGTITESQLAKIRAVDKVKREQRKQIVESDLDGYRILFVGEPGSPGVLESASRRSDVIQYILVLLSDLLESMCLLFIHCLAVLCRALPCSALIMSCLLLPLYREIRRARPRQGHLQGLRPLSTFPPSARSLEQLRRPYPPPHFDRACPAYGLLT